MLKELRGVVRSLARTPGYVLAFVLTLGLGIGLNTAIFSVVNGVLLAPLPYADANRILYVTQPARLAGVDNAGFSFVEVEDIRQAARTTDQVVEYGDWTFNVVADEGDPHRAVGGLVTANYFEVLGLSPQVGRALTVPDDGRDGEPSVVLTHDYWTRAFGADPGVLGRTVKLYAFSAPKTTRIVGVLEPGATYTGSRRVDFFVNYVTNDHYIGAVMQDERTHRMTDVFVRLAPAQTVDAARAEITTVAALVAMAEEARSRYTTLADRAARLYSPLVHILSFAAFGFWMWRTGGDFRHAINISAAVLIITCPCALGLAVPAVVTAAAVPTHIVRRHAVGSLRLPMLIAAA